jgi:signal transduction histidine kinase
MSGESWSRTDSSLARFVEKHYEELVASCRARVAARPVPSVSTLELTHGIPLFLKQLEQSLRQGGHPTPGAINSTATAHGSEMYARGFTPAQVVHDYGDACQAITELAIARDAVISNTDFQALNAVLDNAIADAVTEYSRRRDSADSGRSAPAGKEQLGILAHEIRDYLNGATLAFEALREGSVGLRGSTGAVLDRSLIGIRNLVNNALADVRLTKGLGRPEAVAVRDFIEEVEIGALMEAKARGLRLTVSPVDEGVAVEADRQILGSVVSNFLQNALKFTRRGGHVTLRAAVTTDRVRIEVEDECGGLPAEWSTGRPFAPFEQRNPDRSGVGLGLSIARRGADALGAEIDVRDRAGEGCVFSIDLPRLTRR